MCFQMPLLWLLWMISISECQYAIPSQNPDVRAVSAMCSSEGITASIDFDRPFNGKIYSLDYATVHDCLYYNSLNMETVLFSIPAHRCGTKLTRTTRNIVDEMENRIYVQMDKDTQTAADKQFSFVCQLASQKEIPVRTSSIRRHPPIPTKNSFSPPINPVISSKNDSYATPLLQIPTTTMLPNPIKSINIQRVSAFSSDGHLGNWPIPGAQPYNSNMPPVSTFPRPFPSPIIQNKDIPNSYIHPSLLSPSSTVISNSLSSSDPSRFIPYSPPLSSIQHHTVSNAYPQSPLTNHINSNNDPITAQTRYRNPVDYGRPTMGPPIVPNRIHINEAIGVGLQPVNKGAVTKIKGYPWSEGYPTESTTGAGIRDADMRQNGRDAEETKIKAKTFREEPKRIGVEFTKDEENNKVTDEMIGHAHLISTQEHLAPPPEVFLEIQSGDAPYSPIVSSPIKIGDNISLVVKSKSQMKDEKSFDMFVYSCFATDGPGTTKIDLIDKNGCVVRPEFVSPLKRIRDSSGQMYYFFRISAFKFPGPDDVYFSCSIDITPLRNAQEICTVNKRRKRSSEDQNIRLFDNVKVELEEEYNKVNALDDHLYCLSPLVFYIFCLSFIFILLLFSLASITAISLYFKLSSLKVKRPY